MLINQLIAAFLRTLHDGEHLGWGRALLEGIGADVAMIPALMPLWTKFEAIVHREDMLFSVSKESVETQNIRRFDKRRDMTFREMRHRLKFYTRSENPVVAKAADDLRFVMHPYDQSDKNNLFGETTYIQNLLSELNKSINSVSIDLIPGFRDLMGSLEASNSALDDLYSQRLTALEDVKGLGRRLDVRKEADRIIIDFIKAVNAFYLVNELSVQDPTQKARLERIASFTNSLIMQLERNVAHRRKHPRKKEEKAATEHVEPKTLAASSPANLPAPAEKKGESTVSIPPIAHPAAAKPIPHKNASQPGDSSPQNTS
ncbi:MAG: DUF6261 family protein [Tannerellaceae bacterium]|jgi:hypothetical protein|nr:DUF6261 family protein [Tannerellaceae bacterium]